ncbi:MAG: hypothetical protein BMS9Abin29_0686 [Gemmatimonadota bacterium]|nr:MAG: hypothetical protein BMS9Abin29_0686 [Gemmatimonadota bacterium]
MSFTYLIRLMPPLVLGLAAATVAEVAVVLLLYSGEGLMRALAIILATEIGALALGLMAAPNLDYPNLVDALRRRWMVCLVVFMVATGFAILWSFRPGAGTTAVYQALGLALLGGLPLYSAGTLFGAMASLRMSLGGIGPRIGASGAIGAAIGILAASYAVPRLSAPSVLLFLMVLLSGGALIQGMGLVDEPRGTADESSTATVSHDPVEEEGL